MSEIGERFMEFRMGQQLFAVPLMTVREVLQRPEVTHVPNMPAHFEGMMNLRGQILGIFSIRKKLALTVPKTHVDKQEVVIVIEEEGSSVGIIVDEVTRVLHPTANQIEAPPIRGNDPASQFVQNVIKMDGNLVVILKMTELLGLQRAAKKNLTA